MAKRKKQGKKSSGCGFPLLLVLLCLFVAVAYWQPELPDPTNRTAEWREKGGDLLQQGKETVSEWRTELSESLTELLNKLPPSLREKLSELAAGAAETEIPAETVTLESLPEYAGEAYVILYDNQPSFSEEQTTAEAYESYAELDLLGRCGVTEACIGQELMPTEERGEIGMVKPTGWHTARYDDLVDGKYLYNRCHLIGYQLTGENANEQNLITGTRYLNVEGMLPFENQVADYIQETGNHVLYRVTPHFEGLELVARGVQIEALSVEDDGVCFNVYCYNVQPGVEIDYLTGESWRAEESI